MPKRWCRRHALLFPGPLQFNAPQAELRFDVHYLSLPLRRNEKALQIMLRRALPLTVLQYRIDGRDRLLVQRVRQALADPAIAPYNAQSLAAAVNLSPRSLHWQLKLAGASLKQVKDVVRFEKATSLLLRTAQPIKQIGAAAGFTNEKSFGHAFRGGAGVSPAAFRDRKPTVVRASPPPSDSTTILIAIQVIES